MYDPQLELLIEPSTHPHSEAGRAARLEAPGFGRYFTDHMVTCRFADGAWSAARLTAYGPILVDPAATALHYGQSIFEGFKAYLQPDGGVASFRPYDNARRLADSARRLAMPAFPEDRFVGLADALVRQDRAWVPTRRGESMYIRPLMFATEPILGIRPAKEYLFVLLAFPAGPYFPQGVKPVTVWLSEEYVRAAPGGTGAAKCAGNYAASLLAQAQAAEEGCGQVVWLDAREHRYVEEMGGMNIFFVFQDGETVTLVTPELTGTLLPGITRASILQLAPSLGYHIEERRVSVDEWRGSIESGRMVEAFACGTAAVITPIGRVKSRNLGNWTIAGETFGPVAQRLRAALLDVQYGRQPDSFGWMHRIL